MGGAGGLGRWIARTERLLPVRRCLEVDEAQVCPLAGVERCAEGARAQLASLKRDGYEAVVFERGQERIAWFHGFRLHSFIMLGLLRKESGCIRYVRIDWNCRGLELTGPAESDKELKCNVGVIYPLVRKYRLVAEPKHALRRLDDLLASLSEFPRLYSLGDFNCGHMSDDIEGMLGMRSSIDSSFAELDLSGIPLARKLQWPNFGECVPISSGL